MEGESSSRDAVRKPPQPSKQGLKAAWTRLNGSGRASRKWSDLGSSLKAELTGFTEELDVRCESNRGIRQHFIFSLLVCFGQRPRMNGGFI